MPAGPAAPQPGYGDSVADVNGSAIIVSERWPGAAGAVALDAVAERTLPVGLRSAAGAVDWASCGGGFVGAKRRTT